MSNNIPTAEMSLAEMKAHVERLEAEAAAAAREEFRPVLETLLSRYTIKESATSAHVGFHADPIEMTVNGKRLRLLMTVTDIDAKEARAAKKTEAARVERAALKLKAERENLRARAIELGVPLPEDEEEDTTAE